MYLSHDQAQKLARHVGVRLPRIGYEMSLGGGAWLSSTGHAQFGWFESAAPQPFSIHCRCEQHHPASKCPCCSEGKCPVAWAKKTFTPARGEE